MGILILPVVVLIIVAPGTKPSQTELAQFSRFARALNTQVSLVDRNGVVREGLLTTAATDSITMSFAAGPQVFTRDEVASAERLRDGVKDGVIKGMLCGAVIGIFAAQGFDSTGGAVAGWFGAVTIYGGIGWALDAALKHREPIYRVKP